MIDKEEIRRFICGVLGVPKVADFVVDHKNERHPMYQDTLTIRKLSNLIWYYNKDEEAIINCLKFSPYQGMGTKVI